MKQRLVTVILALSSVNAFAFPCTPYLDDYINHQNEKIDTTDSVEQAVIGFTLGFTAPVTAPICALTSNTFKKRAELAQTVLDSFDYVRFSTEEDLKKYIRDRNQDNATLGRKVRLDQINQKLIRQLKPVMSQKQFDSLYPYNDEPIFTNEYQKIPTIKLLKKLNKVSDDQITYDQLREFILEKRDTNYFCQSKKLMEMTGKNFKRIADDITNGL